MLQGVLQLAVSHLGHKVGGAGPKLDSACLCRQDGTQPGQAKNNLFEVHEVSNGFRGKKGNN